MSRLDGWKSIAGYLGRTVRTAQRWEQEFDLPVRRLGTDRFESVFAFTEELDTWVESGPGARARRGPDTMVEPTSPAVPDGPARSWRRPLALGATAVVTVAIAIGWWSFGAGRIRPCAAPPVAWRMDGATFIATDADGHPCWSRELPITPAAPSDSRVRVLGEGVDLDNDGRREFWVIPGVSDDQTTAAYCLNADGTLRWTYLPRDEVTIGGRVFNGPWRVTQVFHTEDPATPSQLATWVTAEMPGGSPSQLRRIDARSGHPVGDPFWQAGAITMVTMFRCPAGPRLTIGASSHERRAPVLLILDPASPGGAPLAEVAFPRPRGLVGLPGVGRVARIDIGTGPNAFAIDLDYVAQHGLPSVTATFHLDRHLTMTSSTVGQDNARSFALLRRDGVIPNSGVLPADVALDLPAPVVTVRSDAPVR